MARPIREEADRGLGLVARIHRPPTDSGDLDGLDVAVKELVAIGGHELTANTALELPAAIRFPQTDSPVVARLRAAGARIIATTTTHELAWGITTYGRGRRVSNPTAHGRIAGGSSGGSAAAVATATSHLAVGTDTAGSVRIPAAWCGVFGWKAGDDVVPLDGVLPLAPGLDNVGLLARDVRTLWRSARAVGAPDAPIRRIFVVQARGVDGYAQRAVDEAAGALARAALRVEELALPLEGRRLLELFTVVQGSAALMAHREQLATWPHQAEVYDPWMAARLDGAQKWSRRTVEGAGDAARMFRSEVRRLLLGSMLLLPATGCRAPTTSAPDVAKVNGGSAPLREVVLPWTIIANLSGLPALTVPWAVDGEQIGVQLLGGPETDLSLMLLAELLGSTSG